MPGSVLQVVYSKIVRCSVVISPGDKYDYLQNMHWLCLTEGLT